MIGATMICQTSVQSELLVGDVNFCFFQDFDLIQIPRTKTTRPSFEWNFPPSHGLSHPATMMLRHKFGILQPSLKDFPGDIDATLLESTGFETRKCHHWKLGFTEGWGLASTRSFQKCGKHLCKQHAMGRKNPKKNAITPHAYVSV